jgi:putative mRNA 3-end processing factor
VAYGERLDIRGVQVSLHPAGHVLGSAQVRLEHAGRVTVVSGDYKLHADPTCDPFEPVRCDTFITESTFGIPHYRWPEPAEVFAGVHEWWRANQHAGRTSVIHAYAIGKAQRILASIDATLGPILVSREIAELLPAYAAAGVRLPATRLIEPFILRMTAGRALILTPMRGVWGRLRRAEPIATAFASGWVQQREGESRRVGFILSDHADWDGIISAIRATGAEQIGVMHGFTRALVAWLRARGWDAHVMRAGPWQQAPEAEESLLEQEYLPLWRNSLETQARVAVGVGLHTDKSLTRN